jgi:5-methylcytosine-specific restriction endonuclease McrA
MAAVKKKNTGKRAVLFKGRRTRPCAYCGKRLTPVIATVDHVRPVSAGGMHKLSNCVLACKTCNSKKGHMSREQFIKLRSESARRST